MDHIIFESFLHCFYCIVSIDLPVVCIVVEGGPNSIKQVCEAVEEGTPVVVAAKSGRAADVLAFAFNQKQTP